jgi:hypothetical protein
MKLLDLNLLPQGYRRRLNLRSALPWFLLGCYALLLVPLLWFYGSRTVYLEQVQASLASVQHALDNYQPLALEKTALENELEDILRQSGEIEAAAGSATIQEIMWSDVLRSITQMAPGGIEWVSIDQREREVVIIGAADDHRLPLAFADTLTASGQFNSVLVDSLVRLEPEAPESETVEQIQASPRYEFEIRLDLGLAAEEGAQGSP